MKVQILKLYGNLKRRQPEMHVRKITNWRRDMNRPRGRPKTKWNDQIRINIKRTKRNLSLINVTKLN